MNTWHYEKEGWRYSEIKESEMISLIKKGVIGNDTLVWTPGFVEWQYLGATLLAKYLAPSSIPPDDIPMNNAWVWCLSFGPVLGFLLEAVVAAITSGSEDVALTALFDGNYWYISLFLNIALSYGDEMALRHAGINTSGFSKWAWFIPGYLWKRERYLSLGLPCFWVWVGTGVIMLATTF